MKLKIVKNYYAPKIPGIIDPDEKLHCVVWNNCNFRCTYCDFWQRDDIVFKKISLEQFEIVVRYLVKYRKGFKFTGGEPCLNPQLDAMLRIVKKYDGIVFLDTNGSLPSRVASLIDNKLVDIYAISIKGLNKAEALQRSGITNPKCCWDNVITSIQQITERNMTIIATYVIDQSFCYEKLEKYASLLLSLGNTVYLKLNNLMPNDYNHAMQPMPYESISVILQTFIKQYSEFHNRVIYIHEKQAVTNHKQIRFF